MELFSYKDLTFEYECFGTGKNAILCFHGFGRKSHDFSVFSELLKPDQRMISINLFAHGNSSFPISRIETAPLEKAEWKEMLEAFLCAQNISHFGLFGYSMGGRICLTTLEIMHERVRSVLLIAPDGLKINFLYRFASGTQIGRMLYRSLINNPSWLFNLAKVLNKIGILNDKLFRFVHVHLDTREKRQQVHDAWLIYKKIFPDLCASSKLARDLGKNFVMIFGRYDSVIRPELGRKFTHMTGDESQMKLIDAGHRLMTEQTQHFIAEQKLWPD